jgi:three-Cys-motif partner protein
MVPYLSKVKTRRLPIVVIDCFAGKGRFEDNSPGSPIIICQLLEKHANGLGICVFVNKNRNHHVTLTKELHTFVKKKIAYPINADSQSILNEIPQAKRRFTLFAYLDPFGLKGCEFDTIQKLLKRAESTEILINLSMPALHRHAACDAVSNGRNSPQIQASHRLLDQVLGGNYWTQFMFEDRLTPREKESKVVAEYMKRLKKFLPYAGCCPVSEKEGSVVKYYIIFCSGHADGIALMNQSMCLVYNDYMQEIWSKEHRLLAGVLPGWQSDRNQQKQKLKRIIVATLTESRGGLIRKMLWHRIVEAYFMAFLEKEYNAAVKELIDTGDIHFVPSGATRRLNDACLLKLGPKEKLASNG